MFSSRSYVFSCTKNTQQNEFINISQTERSRRGLNLVKNLFLTKTLENEDSLLKLTYMKKKLLLFCKIKSFRYCMNDFKNIDKNMNYGKYLNNYKMVETTLNDRLHLSWNLPFFKDIFVIPQWMVTIEQAFKFEEIKDISHLVQLLCKSIDLDKDTIITKVEEGLCFQDFLLKNIYIHTKKLREILEGITTFHSISKDGFVYFLIYKKLISEKIKNKRMVIKIKHIEKTILGEYYINSVPIHITDNIFKEHTIWKPKIINSGKFILLEEFIPKNEFDYYSNIPSVSLVLSGNMTFQMKNLIYSLKTNICSKSNLSVEFNINSKEVKFLSEVLRKNKNIKDFEIKGKLFDSHSSRNYSKSSNFHNYFFSIGSFVGKKYALNRLELTACFLGDEGCKYIAKGLILNKILQTLILSKNSISELGITYLSNAIRHNKCIKELSLENNNLKKASLKYIHDFIKTNSSISKLNLSDNDLCLEITSFSKVLKQNSCISSIHLKGVRLEKGIELLLNNSCLTEINLENNRLGMYILSFLSKIDSYRHIKEINLEKNYSNRDYSHIRVVMYDSLTKVSFDIPQTLYEENYLEKVLIANKGLTSLTLGYKCEFTENKIKYISNLIKDFDHMTELILESCKIDDFGAQQVKLILNQNKNLSAFNLYDNNISDYGAWYISDAVGIKQNELELNLGKNKVLDKGAKWLFDAIKDKRIKTVIILKENNISITLKDLILLQISKEKKLIKLIFND
jgi:hypothetical protein